VQYQQTLLKFYSVAVVTALTVALYIHMGWHCNQMCNSVLHCSICGPQLVLLHCVYHFFTNVGLFGLDRGQAAGPASDAGR
jgi:hypothetical protein